MFKSLHKCLFNFVANIGLSVSPVVTIAKPDSLSLLIAKLSIACFLHPERPSAQVALEHKLGKYWYLNHQVAYISYNPFSELFIRQSSLRLRSGSRRYVKSLL